MAVRSKRLAGPVALQSSSAVVYTAAAGETVLIKSLMWSNDLGNTASHLYELFINGGGNADRVLALTVPAGETAYLEVWFVLQPGDTLRAKRTGAGSGRITVSGAELEGVAD